MASDFLLSLLARRGITTSNDVSNFLHPDYELHTHDPFLLQGMDRAAERVLRAIEKNERIALYADFDCDGIPGAALFSDFLKKAGCENFEVYVPHRDREGYGFHVEAIAELSARGTTLIVAVDVGTNAVAAVGYAKQLGIDCVIADHHEVTGVLPDAIAVLNPKLGSYPFRELCGASVAFKLVQAALAKGARRLPSLAKIPRGWEKWLLDMVAIATIADMVPLLGENRVLASYGIKVLRKSVRPGIRALCAQLRLKQSELTEDDISFSFAPRINAASRMDEPHIALSLLTTRSTHEADKLARVLEKLNTARKGIVGTLVRQAREKTKTRYIEEDRIIVLGSTEWKPALLGLAANSLVQERGGVVCLWGRDGNGKIKGSCRSDGSVSVVDLFVHARDAFEEYGGHSRSGGFTVSPSAIYTLPETLAKVAEVLETRVSVQQKIQADSEITLSSLSSKFFEEVSLLAPFGIGNPKPVFRVEEILVTEVRRFGKNLDHIELFLECRKTGARARAFDFFRSPEQFSCTPARGHEVCILASIERDSFRGGLALRVVDVLAAS